MQAIYHGHSFVEIETDQGNILIDPFVSENPRCDVKLEELLKKNITHIVLTHGHDDHVGDTVAIALQTGCKVIAMVELCDRLETQGIEKSPLEKHNIGGSYTTEDFSVQFVQAIHSNSNPDGGYAGLASGLIFTFGNQKIYHAGDTALFSDMSLFTDIDVAFLPIGDRFTMGVEDAIKATAFIKPKTVVPIHYNTRSQIKADDIEFARQVMLGQYAIPKVLRAGQYVVL